MPDGYDNPQFQEETVREYMEAHGLTPAQIERVVGDYTRAYYTAGSVEGIDAKTNLDAWMEAKVRQFSAGTPNQPGYETVVRGADEAADANERSFAAVQEMARQSAAERRQAVQNRTYEGARIDHGPGMDPDVIANSLETGVWTDAEGNYIDPNTGLPLPPGSQGETATADSIWQAIKGQQFNMGALAFPGTPQEQLQGLTYGRHVATKRPMIAHPSADAMERNPGQRGAVRYTPAGHYPSRPRRFVTPSQALSMLSSMSENQLMVLQQQMFAAGLYPEDSKPTWGRPDVATRTAFKNLFLEAGQRPGQNVAAVMADLMDEQMDRMAPAEGSPGSGGADLPVLTIPDFEPNVMNEEELNASLDELATELTGAYLNPEVKAGIVGKMREREIGLQRQQYDRDVSRVRAEYDAQVSTMALGGGGGGSMGDVDAFLAALSGQESGGDYFIPNRSGSGAYGKYQIMPGNWPSWSRRAGLPPGSPQTPQNQEIVARQIVMDYFEQFGNWRDVAVAWYAGPGSVAGKRFSDRPQRGGPSINDYADEVMGRYARARRGTAEAGATTGPVVGGSIYAPIEAFDPIAEARAAIKAADPAGWQANEWSDRAIEWFSAVASSIGGS